MSYDHGSGIKNPFRFIGTVRCLRGLVTGLLGLYLLLKVPGLVKQAPAYAWTYVGFGIFTLGVGLKEPGKGACS